MKKIAIVVALTSIAALGQAGSNSSVTGKWRVHTELGGQPSDSVCTFVQNGPSLSGTCTTTGKDVMKVAGNVQGNKVTWAYSAGYNGSPFTVTTAGTLNGGQITGTVTMSIGGMSSAFTATPTK